ncbi:MAG: hypothetical protein WC254_05025 [Candidatus Woesearchaeota archaeon]|jgi:hypothetical protein
MTLNLEIIVEKLKKKNEYWTTLISTELGGLVGSLTSSYVIPQITSSTIARAAGILSGEYILATAGQIGAYWYHNKEKAKQEDGSINYTRALIDTAKILLYDIPITSTAYAITAPCTYYMVSHNWNKGVTAVLTSLTVMAVWNGMNYLVYNVIKERIDEKILQNAVSLITSRTSTK